MGIAVLVAVAIAIGHRSEPVNLYSSWNCIIIRKHVPGWGVVGIVVDIAIDVRVSLVVNQFCVGWQMTCTIFDISFLHRVN